MQRSGRGKYRPISFHPNVPILLFYLRAIVRYVQYSDRLLGLILLAFNINVKADHDGPAAH